MTRIYAATPTELAELAALLAHGEVVAIPTETVYGLAANAYDEVACRKVFAIKGRPLIDPLIVHLAPDYPIERVARPNEAAQKLAETFWPGPLTIILPKQPTIPDLVTASKPTVAVRRPRHPAAQGLLKACGFPLAAPSANPFGYVSPTRLEHVLDSLGDQIDFALNGGPCEVGLESTIIDLTEPDQPLLRRPGALSREQLAEVLGTAIRDPIQIEPEAEAQTAPGSLNKHYSPKARLRLLDEPPPTSRLDECTATIYATRPESAEGTSLFWLTENGAREDAHRNLFHILREVDRQGFERIDFVFEDWIQNDEALMDRLRRAAAKG